MITGRIFTGKRFAVLGLARSGKAVVEALAASGAEVLAWDNRESAREDVPKGVQIGDPLVEDLSGYDAIVVSPGVPINRHPIADRAKQFGLNLIGDIELFAMARAELPPHKLVGITGTNGKSTTTALVHHILKKAGYSTLMGGNIGLPILAQMPLEPNAKGPAVYVLELSSFQIDLTSSLDCDVAALLNISPDHLDRYDDFEAYASAKARLFTMQSESGRMAVLPLSATHVKAIDSLSDLDQFAIWIGPPYQEDQSNWPALQGPHNLENVQFARNICEQLGLTAQQIEHGLRSFTGLPHRMELIAEYRGVRFVNDSKATNTAATAPALAAYHNVHWILGGLAKEKGLDECAPYFNRVKCAYTIGEAGPDYSELLAPHMPVRRSEMLCMAVKQAFAEAQPGDVVLLSPACASFDQFRDFEARGAHFRAVIEQCIAADQAQAVTSKIQGAGHE